jgi:probable addiction module antidote protein
VTAALLARDIDVPQNRISEIVAGRRKAIAEYLTAALETGEASFIADALGIVARAKGMTRIAEDAGLGRESLYKSLREGANPELTTVLRVIRALGLRLTAAPAVR